MVAGTDGDIIVETSQTASHSRRASSPRGTRLITGPKNDACTPSLVKLMIGVPRSLPVRLSASSVSARSTASHASSLAASR